MSIKSFNDLKVLVVEDQLEARTMLRNMLMEIGVNQVFDAPDGREALTFIDSCLLYTSPSPRDQRGARMPSSA